MRKIKASLLFLTFFCFWLLLISLLWTKPLILTIILAIICGVYFLFFREKQGLYFFIAAGLFGPIGEAIVSANGLWTYHGQTIFGIPYWLPLAWGITAVALHKFLIDFTKRS